MSKINDLTQGNLGDMKRQQHRDRYATPLNGSSVGSGGQRFYGTGRLTVENEGLYVVGTANISGLLNVTGTSTFTGDTSLNGPTDVAGTFTVTGPTTLDGVTDIGGATTITGSLDVTGPMATKGTLSVEGVTTLENDLNVTAGGKVTAGDLTISPFNGGSVSWLGGSLSAAAGFGTTIIADSMDVVSQGVLGLEGATQVSISAPNVTITTLPTTTQKPNLYADANGRLYRSTAV